MLKRFWNKYAFVFVLIDYLIFAKALILDPSDLVCRYNLALCCEELAIHEIREAGSSKKFTASGLDMSLSCLEISQRYLTIFRLIKR
jgi:hypothetical protein